ncbi:NADPH-dependent F420 reductase [Polyangium sorediatum]|uniref:NAD(P)-binding domain-containing protein n=1 Tax=Polyangium sorediatum TaxID=889274 RepID=A0ABT6P9N6_9BACT|nr:NAD(P)-binding domain-containing protein [Polyangium sorediatum]MDI1437296.1 NAD(P)-binding domain-containing protein [Polyangium sorediatum]
MKIGILGSGDVAKKLGKGFLETGHAVMLGSREASKVAGWSDHAEAKAGTFAETAAFGQIVVLAVKGTVAVDAVKLAGLEALAGKTVIDATNPIADAPPVDGVLQFFTGPNDSLMERLQATAPDAHFVKAFSSVGSGLMFRPNFPGGRPTMFIAGNSEEAKAEVRRILDTFGWDSEDIGKAAGARAIEPLCQLWCAPGFQRNQWTHAFKLLKL